MVILIRDHITEDSPQDLLILMKLKMVMKMTVEMMAMEMMEIYQRQHHLPNNILSILTQDTTTVHPYMEALRDLLKAHPHRDHLRDPLRAERPSQEEGSRQPLQRP